VTLSILSQHYPILNAFTIARGSKTKAEVVVCQIDHQGKIGRGEGVPYGRYGETMLSVITALEKMKARIDFSHKDLGQIHADILENMSAGAARNALDCALWDLEAKLSGKRVHEKLGFKPQALTTAYTLSLAEAREMGQAAYAHAHYPLLKIKVGGSTADEDIARIQAVRTNAPKSRLIVDANEGWDESNIEQCLAGMAAAGVSVVEQPLPAGQDDLLGRIPHPVAIYADESVHVSADLARLKPLYDGINIKLDKTGGLSEALALKQQARQMGFGIMVGCMVATSLAMAPAQLLAQDADFVDLDGPLLLARDRAGGLHYQEARIFPPEADLWG